MDDGAAEGRHSLEQRKRDDKVLLAANAHRLY